MNKYLKSVLSYILFMAAGLAFAYAAMQAPALFSENYSEADNGEYFAGKQERVLVYGTSWCKYCQQTRDYLMQNQIGFHDLDIEKSDLAKQQYEKLGGGGVPIVLIGNRRIHGYIPGAFDEARKALLQQ